MKKYCSIFAVLFLILAKSQVISSSRWSDLFSYNNVLQIREDNGKLIAATENGLFFYTPATGEITKLSKANGLHEVKISAFDYNPETKTGLVGYMNGTMDVIKEDGITFVVDIPLANGFTGSKKINHISITGNLAVVSVGYGISIFNLEKKEFGDSAFFITNGVFEPSKEAVIKDNTVYSITNSGIKKHDINVTFPIYSTWTTAVPGTFNHIDIESKTIAFASSTQMGYGDGSTFTLIPQTFNNIQDVIVTTQNISVTDLQTIYNFSHSGAPSGNLITSENLNTAWFSGGQTFAGTKLSGILNKDLKSFKPDGPYNNRAYKIFLKDDKIWVSTGARVNRYNAAPPLDQTPSMGFFFFNGNEWIYPSFFKNNPIPFNILDVIATPSDYKETFFTNYSQSNGQGFYKMKYNETSKDFDLVKYYSSQQNPAYNRPVGFAFDDKNNLYATTVFYSEDISTTYVFYDKTSDDFIYKKIPTNGAAQKPIFYEGLLLIPIPRNNNFAIVDLKNSTSFSDDESFILTSNNGLPAGSQGSLSIAIDKNDDAWIGTDNGLRVLSSISTKYKDDPVAEPVIIEQNGIGEELFRDTSVIQIEVDSGNQKWVSLYDGGVFHLTPSGQKTINYFTRENSPLPTNIVTDIKIDSKTGKVFFATFDGIVVYQGDVANVTENFGNVVVYPNPVVFANYKGNVKIKGLAEKTNIRITDSAGNLVHQAISRGGFYEWDLTNKGKRVSSGVYFVLMTNSDGTDKATAKIAVVN